MEEKQILWENTPRAVNQAMNGCIPTSAFYGYVPFMRSHDEKVYDSGYKNGVAFAVLWQVLQKHKPQNTVELRAALVEEINCLPTGDMVLLPVYQQMIHEIDVGL